MGCSSISPLRTLLTLGGCHVGVRSECAVSKDARVPRCHLSMRERQRVTSDTHAVLVQNEAGRGKKAQTGV